MLALRNLSIRAKLFIVIALLLGGFSLLGSVTARTLNRTKVGGPLYNEVILGKDLLADVLPPPLFIIEAYLTVHEIEDETDPARIRVGVESLRKLIAGFKGRIAHWDGALTAGELKESLLKDSGTHASEFLDICEVRFVPLMLDGKFEEARAVVHGDLDRLYSAHRASIDRTVELATAFSAEQEASARGTVDRGLRLLIMLGASVAIVIASITWLVSRGINRALRAIRTVTEVEGDLTRRVNLSTSDELGQFAQWLNRFLSTLHDMISRVVSTANQVGRSTQEIEAAGRSMAAAIAEQAQQTTQTSTAVEEMSASIVEVARKAADSATAASRARDASGEGATVVRAVIDGIQGIARVVSESSTAIDGLGKRGEQIGSIIETIEDIADQTNLLALNAAIEAARAGEHGRGFAVVADEVRKLAERTMKATQEVAQSIKGIQADTEAAIARMSACSDAVTKGVGQAQQAGQALDGIASGSHEISGMVQSIAAATEEQSAASEEITRNIAGMADGSQRNAQHAEQVSKNAECLSRATTTLMELVANFKVSASDSSR